MIGFQLDGGGDVGARLGQSLTGQRKDKVEAEFGDSHLARPFRCLASLLSVVDTAQLLEKTRVERLRPQAEPIDSGLGVTAKLGPIDSARVGLQGNLGAGLDAEQMVGTLQERADRSRSEE